MKTLIGTPIHICKDYSMERWLDNVAKLQKVSPADLLLVDNSPGTEYVEKVRGYCEKYGVQNYRIEHLEISQEVGIYMRVELSQEMIRKEMLSSNYDMWFSWECDQIIPTDALDKLVQIMKIENCMMVIHNSWARWNPDILNTNMGCTLIKRECLEKYGFLPYISNIDPENEIIFKERVLKGGDNYIEVYGIITPIVHLNL